MAAPDMMETTLDGVRDIRVYQNKEGYRFSVDAVLLASFVNVRHARRIIDLGAGSGIIGLLLARRYHLASSVLVEFQESLFTLARRNIGLNGLEDRVEALQADIRDLRGGDWSQGFDLVVSNPPFRCPSTGRISVGEERAVARHEIALRLADLAATASRLLKDKGRFFMIYHPGRLLEVFDTLRANRLEPKRIRFVHNSIGAESKIVLIEAAKDGRQGLKIEGPLYVYDEGGGYTHEVQRMYEGEGSEIVRST